MSRRDPFPPLPSLRPTWQYDVLASISVALVALPLGLGVALASGAPALAGLIPSVIGGILATFVRGSHLAINGPSKGLVPVVLGAIVLLDDGQGGGYAAVLAAFVISGALQILGGFLRLGRLGRYLPAAVITGMLAAIGVIIITSQLPSVLGTHAHAHGFVSTLQELPQLALHAHPQAIALAVISLGILLVHPRIRNSILTFIPGPMWVLVLTFPLLYLLGLIHPYLQPYFHTPLALPKDLLVPLPDPFWEGLPFPDFSQVGRWQFWMVVGTVFLVSSVESLLSARAVDSFDPKGRKTSLDRDLAAMGGSTIASAFLGGLPVITVVLCSAVNVNQGAKTRWSNVYHALIILALVLGLGGLLRQVPLAVLAAILIVSSYKLTAPKVYRDALRKGWEQLVLLLGTLLACMLAGLLPGLLLGLIFTLLLHWAKTGFPFPTFWRMVRQSQIRVNKESDNDYFVRIKGVINFLTLANLERTLNSLPNGKHVVLDFSLTRLIDYASLEYLHEYAEFYLHNGGEMDLTGLALHKVSSDHPYALHVLPTKRIYRLSRRQQSLKHMAADEHWHFDPSLKWETAELRQFDFFSHRTVEYKRNLILGQFVKPAADWELADVTYDEGALLAREVRHTTVLTLHLPFTLPEFRLEREDLLDKVWQLTGEEDIDFVRFEEFSRKYLLLGPDEEAIRWLFSPELISFFEGNEIYHLECKGNALMVFRHQRLASTREVMDMIHYGEGLCQRLEIDASRWS